MAVAIEHGTVETGKEGKEVTVAAPSVTTSSTILLTEGSSHSFEPSALVVGSREVGVGFVIRTGAREGTLNWLVIN